MIGRFALRHVALLAATAVSIWAAVPKASDFEHDKSWATVSGPARDIHFEPLTRADGIPTDHVFQILEDHRGFMWFTTREALVRYDGYQHVRYTPLPLVRMRFSGAMPALLYEDRNGTLWLGTDVLSRFDPTHGTFTTVVQLRPGPRRHGLEAITAIHDGPGGFIWTGVWSVRSSEQRNEETSEPILYQVDPIQGTSTPHPINLALTSAKPLGIRAITSDRTRVWLDTAIGLFRFDPTTGIFTAFPHSHKRVERRPGTAYNALIWDHSGHLWRHTPDGLERFDPETGVYDRFTAGEFWEMTPDPSGKIWLWGGTTGLKIFDPSSPPETALNTVSFTSSFGQPGQETRMISLGVDRHGRVWVYGDGGMYRHSPTAGTFRNYVPDPRSPDSLSGGEATGFAEDADGSMWIATQYSGLNKFDPRSGKFTRFRHDPRNGNSLISDTINTIYVDRSQSLWIGTDKGVGVFDRKSEKYTHLRGAKLTRPASSLYEDSTGRFWVGTGFGPLQLVDRRTGAITPTKVQGGYLTYEDRRGNLWFCFRGLNKLDPAGNLRSFPLREPDASNPSMTEISSIYEDSSGILWLASTQGLYEFDPRSEKARLYTTADGLASTLVRCVVPGQDGSLWMSTARGISRFDPHDKRFSNFDERDGLQGHEFLQYFCYAAQGGRIYFGETNGFTAFYPQDVLVRPQLAPVVITAFQVKGKETPVLGVDAVRLQHLQNDLTFEFAVLNSLNPGEIRYRFKLDGKEVDWVPVDTEHRLARYTDLPPGDYVFRAEASTDGRSWTSKGAALNITIVPPWWGTRWAETSGGLLLIGLLLAAYKLRVRALHQRQEYLARLVDQRTAELVEARDQAQAANRAKSVFLANMSHELRTPLNAILGFSHLLRATSVYPEERTQLNIINRSGEHLLTLINDVLDLAKIEAGKQELTIETCELASLVENVVEMLRVRADGHKLSLTWVPSASLPRYVRADASKLRQVLINLLGNAIKFTEAGAVTLRLDASKPDGDGRVRLRFEVEDTGVGIPPEQQARIFEPFVQSGKPSAQQGTGLGLTITRHYVEMMGGTLTLESTPGRGSRFTVEVPAELARESEGSGAESGEEFLSVLEPGQPEWRVLVVEDSEESAVLLEQLLTRAGFHVRVAENGALGVKAFLEWRPHFIWMDSRMPEMTGPEATRRIRELEHGRDVKIVAMTASVFASERAQVLAAGMDDFVLKPYRPAEVFACLQRLLGVRYRQVEWPAPEAGLASLQPESLAALPKELLQGLSDAVISLDRERVSAAIDRIGDQDGTLAAVLRRLHDRFAYTAILDAIRRSESRPFHLTTGI